MLHLILLILSCKNNDELKAVIKRKFPAKYRFLDTFLLELPFEYAYTVK